MSTKYFTEFFKQGFVIKANTLVEIPYKKVNNANTDLIWLDEPCAASKQNQNNTAFKERRKLISIMEALGVNLCSGCYHGEAKLHMCTKKFWK